MKSSESVRGERVQRVREKERNERKFWFMFHLLKLEADRKYMRHMKSQQKYRQFVKRGRERREGGRKNERSKKRE